MNELYVAELSQDVFSVIENAPFNVAVASLAEAAKQLAKNDDDLTYISEAFNQALTE